MVYSTVGAGRCVIVRQQPGQVEPTDGQATKFAFCQSQSNLGNQPAADIYPSSFATAAVIEKL
jgi:hypothetical protein